MKEFKKVKDITKEAHRLGAGEVSMYIWELCCRMHGSGGTKKANEMYNRIMTQINKELTN